MVNLSFIGCFKRRSKITKSDIPKPKPIEQQDIHVQTIDLNVILEPVSNNTVSIELIEPIEPMILPGQPVIDTQCQEVVNDLIANVVKEESATPILDTQRLADELIASIIKAEPEAKPEAKPEVTEAKPEVTEAKPEVTEAKPEVTGAPVKQKPKNTIRALYNHRYWPSPRPVNFVRSLYGACYIQTNVSGGRLTHEKALAILASYGSMTVDELLQITPIQYLETKFKFTYSQIKSFPALRGVEMYYY